MSTLLQEVRYAARSLLKSPGFLITAVFTLTLAVGTNAAFFSIFDSVLLRPYPYRDSDRLAVVRFLNPRLSSGDLPLAYPDFADFKDQTQAFEELAAVFYGNVIVAGSDAPLRVRGVRVSQNLFKAIGTDTLAGRTFLPAEDQPGGEKVAVLSERLWRRSFAGDPGIVGRALRVDGEPVTVVGVVAAATQLPAPNDAEIFMPIAKSPAEESRLAYRYFVVGRLKPGMTLQRANTEAVEIARRIAQLDPEQRTGFSAQVISLRESRTGDDRPTLLLGLVAVVFVLLIACANVANLLLQRAVVRQRVVAVRTALGASRARLVREMLIESLLLVLISAATGLLMASWLLKIVVGMLPPDDLPAYMNNFQLDLRSAFFLLCLCLLAVLIFGLAPALRSSRQDVSGWLQETAGRSQAGGRHRRFRNSLLVVEIALSLVLLIVAGLLIRSFRTLLSVDPGFDIRRTLAVQLVPLSKTEYPTDAARGAFYRGLLEQVEAVPGIETAALSLNLPVGGWNGTAVVYDGMPQDATQRPPALALQIVEGRYFETIDQGLVAGRLFTAEDRAGTLPVAIINQRAAQGLWPGDSPIGKRVRLPDAGGETLFTLVGVVESLRRRNLMDNRSQDIYVLADQVGWKDMMVLGRAKTDPLAVIADLRQTVQRVSPDLLSDVRPLATVVRESLSMQRVSSALAGIFAAFSLFMAMVGMYGAISYAVSERTNEIAIRMTMGAQRGDVLRMIVRQMLTLGGIGVVVGLIGAVLVSQAMASLLFGFGASSVLVFVVSATLVLFMTMAASFVPAYRASNLHPAAALRAE